VEKTGKRRRFKKLLDSQEQKKNVILFPDSEHHPLIKVGHPP
jgi:hypothetical protein